MRCKEKVRQVIQAYNMHSQSNIKSHTPKGREEGQNEINGLLSFAHIPLNSIKPNHARLIHILPIHEVGSHEI